MALDIFFRDDLRNMLRGLVLTSLTQAAAGNPDADAREFVRGYMSALAAVGAALGCTPAELGMTIARAGQVEVRR